METSQHDLTGVIFLDKQHGIEANDADAVNLAQFMAQRFIGGVRFTGELIGFAQQRGGFLARLPSFYPKLFSEYVKVTNNTPGQHVLAVTNPRCLRVNASGGHAQFLLIGQGGQFRFILTDARIMKITAQTPALAARELDPLLLVSR